MIPIVLASASPRRRALLTALGLEVEVRTSAVDETLDGDPHDIVLQNAIAKRDDIARHVDEDAIVVAADTIVVLDGVVMGKPADLDEAVRMLTCLSGNTHEVLTGVAIQNTATGDTAEGIETTRVTFRELSEDDIARFIDAVKPLDRAGAYTVDGPGSLLVSRYEGCYQNVLGLPMVRLDGLFQELGDSLFARVRAGSAKFL